jgi:hypothetical protein
MDSLQKWHAHIADVKTLFTHWEERRLARIPVRKKDREDSGNLSVHALLGE